MQMTALTELARVLSPGRGAVSRSQSWGSIRSGSAEEERARGCREELPASETSSSSGNTLFRETRRHLSLCNDTSSPLSLVLSRFLCILSIQTEPRIYSACFTRWHVLSEWNYWRPVFLHWSTIHTAQWPLISSSAKALTQLCLLKHVPTLGVDRAVHSLCIVCWQC